MGEVALWFEVGLEGWGVFKTESTRCEKIALIIEPLQSNCTCFFTKPSDSWSLKKKGKITMIIINIWNISN